MQNHCQSPRKEKEKARERKGEERDRIIIKQDRGKMRQFYHSSRGVYKGGGELNPFKSREREILFSRIKILVFRVV